MGKKLALLCPRCSSQDIVQNGHHHQRKAQFHCKTCHKYFYEDPAKGYPPTNIPFPVVAYLLHFRKKIPAFSNMRKFRRFVSQWLECLRIKKGEVSRQIIHHWIKQYEPYLENIINFQEAQDYVHNLLSENLKDVPKEEIKARTHPYRQTLKKLEESLGRRFCIELSRRDPVFFNELVDIVSKQQLYCHRLDREFEQPTAGLFFRGVVG
jgi:hypothetical protein